jgi:hypothetical protein
MSADDVAAERARAHELLRLGDLDMTWTEEPAVPAPEDIGALDGFRVVSADGAVRISIYVYGSWGEGGAAGQALTEMVDGDEYHAQSTVNGRLMCFGVTAAGSASGCHLLDQALGALAGWE